MLFFRLPSEIRNFLKLRISFHFRHFKIWPPLLLTPTSLRLSTLSTASGKEGILISYYFILSPLCAAERVVGRSEDRVSRLYDAYSTFLKNHLQIKQIHVSLQSRNYGV
jgi:hypothetical protein